MSRNRHRDVVPKTLGGRGARLVLLPLRKPPGRYRVLVRNWAGPPQSVDLLITFLNRNGEAGTP